MGAFLPPPPGKTPGPIIDARTAFECSRLKLSEYNVKCCPGVTDGLIVQVTSQSFNYVDTSKTPFGR